MIYYKKEDHADDIPLTDYRKYYQIILEYKPLPITAAQDNMNDQVDQANATEQSPSQRRTIKTAILLLIAASGAPFGMPALAASAGGSFIVLSLVRWLHIRAGRHQKL
jgi:hypothetical protein